MSFKLLAIRPLKGTSPDLLKGLKENCIYRFYNEYEYLNDKGDNLNDTEFKNISVIEGKQIIRSYKEAAVSNVKYTEQVPNNFYGKNINVSAIVGENGSGKSSLLELFYYSKIILSKHFELIKKSLVEMMTPLQEMRRVVNIELYFLDKDRKNRDIIRRICITPKKDDNGANIDYEIHENIFTKSIVENCCYKYKSKESKVDLDFYSNILNYSIYGLNSNIMDWIDDVFIKNDGYQAPIVISPFKDKGNIDINKEYLLSQGRLILYVFVLKQEMLLENFYMHEFNFFVDIDKHQFLYPSSENTHKVLDSFLKFCKELFNYEEDSVKRSINLIFDSLIDYTITEDYINDFLKIIKIGKISSIDFVDDNYNKSELLRYLLILYIFKKLERISENYKEYNKYNFLFKNATWFNESDWNSDDSYNKSQIEDWLKTNNIVLNDKQEFEIDMNKTIDLVELTVKMYLDGLKTHTDFNYQTYYLGLESTKKSFIDFLSRIKDLDLKAFYGEIAGKHKAINNYSIERFYEFVIKNLKVNLNNKNFTNFIFTKYLDDLKKDNSHITFKLKQSLHYFKNDIFSKLFYEVDENNFNGSKVKINIDEEYFDSINKIEDAPLAFFEHDIKVIKSNITDEFERTKLISEGYLKPFAFSSLSSGEQQMINSMLTIVYHIHNLLSVEERSDKIVYKKFNLMFDELELYLHPEYQRKYVNDLVKMLEVFKDKEIEFNIVMSTHSPFILSDIPSQNVLKLKEGIPVSHDSINSFGANIHDLLADEFFLNNGFMGEFSSSKIKGLYDRIGGLSAQVLSEDYYNQLRKEINLIGETVLRTPLLNLLDKEYQKKHTDNDYLIRHYEKIIQELNKK